MLRCGVPWPGVTFRAGGQSLSPCGAGHDKFMSRAAPLTKTCVLRALA